MRTTLNIDDDALLVIRKYSSLHDSAQTWFRGEPERLWATCALTRGGFLRVASRYVPDSRHAISEVLGRLEFDCRSGFHEYWPVDIDTGDLSASQRSKLIGHNQVTDMQLMTVAHRHKGRLVTFDKGIGPLAQATGYSQSVLVLPV